MRAGKVPSYQPGSPECDFTPPVKILRSAWRTRDRFLRNDDSDRCRVCCTPQHMLCIFQYILS